MNSKKKCRQIKKNKGSYELKSSDSGEQIMRQKFKSLIYGHGECKLSQLKVKTFKMAKR